MLPATMPMVSSGGSRGAGATAAGSVMAGILPVTSGLGLGTMWWSLVLLLLGVLILAIARRRGPAQPQ
jgi:hypothetical protein